MLKSLELENFRGFEKHFLPLKPLTVIVGQNNAGKSTIVEALRLVAIVVNRYKNLGYTYPPSKSDLPRREIGVSPSLRNIEINTDSIFYRYGDPPLIITATFNDNSSVTIYFWDDGKLHAVIRDQSGDIVKTRKQAIQVNLPTVNIMPQVAPVDKNEIILTPEYVRSTMSSSLAPLHFRNHINIQLELYREFQRVVEETWPGVRVIELIGKGNLPQEPLFLQIRNEDFVAEISAMGHGLQMWLQTMWFLTKSKNSNTVILDEPDVYMHADLQRRLIRFIRNRYPQVILTTHSIEIMSEVEPDEILVVDKSLPSSKFASSLPAVQRLIENVGSVHNIHLAKLWNSRRFIMIEGKDIKLLKIFQNIIFPDSEYAFDSIPNMQIGGWGGWKFAVGSSMLLQNSFGEKILTYCILDSDYHTEEEKNERRREAELRNVELHIWSQKEIENYLLGPEVIHRLIHKNISRRTTGPTIEEINEQIDLISQRLEDEIFDSLSTEILSRHKALGSGGANKEARRIIIDKKEKNEFLSIVSGKSMITNLLQWSQNEFGVSLSALKIAREFTIEEISEEIKSVVDAIEKGEPFN